MTLIAWKDYCYYNPYLIGIDSTVKYAIYNSKHLFLVNAYFFFMLLEKRDKSISLLKQERSRLNSTAVVQNSVLITHCSNLMHFLIILNATWFS